MPAPSLEPADIREVVSRRVFDQGRDYADRARVVQGTRSGSVLEARVQGRRDDPYQVSVDLDDLAAQCDCPVGYGGRCRHVVAVVLSFIDQPDAFPQPLLAPERERPEVDVSWPPEAPEALRGWAREHGVADVLDLPASQLARSRGSGWDWPGEGTVGEALHRAGDQREAMLAWLHRVARARGEALAFEQQAETWRGVEPDAPALAALWRRLRRLRADLREGQPPSHHGGRDTIALQADPPALVFRPAGYLRADVELRLQADQLTDEPEHPFLLAAVDQALDLLTHPDLSEHRDRLRAVLATAPWERLADDLEAAVAAAAPRRDERDREIGWLLSGAGDALDLRPVWCRPYKRKAGWRTWQQSVGTLDPADLPREADRVAAALLAAAEGTAFERNRALQALVGHPRVLWGDEGRPVAVRRGLLEIAWVPLEGGGLCMVPTVDGERVPPGRVGELLATWGADRLVWVDAEASRCTLLEASRPVLEALRVLHRRGGEVPAEAVPALLQRVESWRRRLPIALRGSLRGRQVQGDPRPLLRLAPGPDGGLEVEVWVRPLAGGPPCRPGEGPYEVSAVRDGERVFARRDRSAEPQRVRDALQDLLPVDDGWSLALTDPEQGLATVQALREAGDALQIEWRQPPPTVTRPAAPSDLQVQASRRHDWLGVDGGVQVQGHTVPLPALLEALREQRRYVRAGERAWVVLSDELRRAAEGLASVVWAGRGGAEMSPLAARALEPLEQAGAEVEVPEPCRLSLRRIAEAAELEPEVPPGLQATLRPYQRVGFTWLARLAHWSTGACLADDMGLGKTVQALALLLHLAERGPALVVAPASVGGNWAREAARFAPDLDVRTYRGPDRQGLLDDLGPGQVLITSWGILVRDVEALAERWFATVVLDEAQAIKNPDTRRSRGAARLDAGFVLALTGTPVENRVGEVWSLFRTLAPGVLGSQAAFRRRYVVPIERAGDERARRALSEAIRPFVLRRTKAQVATDLPERIEIIERVELSEPERRLYEQWRRSAVEALEASREGDEPGRFKVLAALTRLRQLACHPRLVDPHAPVARSAKVERLVELVDELRDEGHQALVFSQFTQHLGLIREALSERGVSLLQLDGSMPAERRQQAVDAFQRGEADVFLISLRAGGTGLNLTAASYVIHMDPWWNPALEDQASDRAHRIGQTQPVTVYRLVAEGTVEESVIALHDEKRALVAGLLEGTGSTTFAPDDWLDLVRDGVVGA